MCFEIPSVKVFQKVYLKHVLEYIRSRYLKNVFKMSSGITGCKLYAEGHLKYTSATHGIRYLKSHPEDHLIHHLASHIPRYSERYGVKDFKCPCACISIIYSGNDLKYSLTFPCTYLMIRYVKADLKYLFGIS
jgi:hypothetical protein